MQELFRDESALAGSPLCGDPEQLCDELRPPYRVSPAQPFNLSLTQHVQGFNTRQCSLYDVEGAEALRLSTFS